MSIVPVGDREFGRAERHRGPLHARFARSKKDGNNEKYDDARHWPIQTV